jgi:hypothetical protein
VSTHDWRRLLGYGGLVPFVGLALAAWFAGPALAPRVALAQAQYGAVILAFVGALHWGRGLAAEAAAVRAGPGSPLVLVWSVLPSLWAWVALMLPLRIALPVLAAGLLLAWRVDRRLYAADHAQPWHAGFMRLRAQLTLVAVCSLLAVAAAPATA